MTRIALFASGTGSNAVNIASYFRQHLEVDAEVALVLSNRREAPVLSKLSELGIPAFFVDKAMYDDPVALLSLLRQHAVEWIVLAGFLKLIPPYLLAAYPNRIINIHPALLPKYGGKGMYGDHVHRAVVEAGDNESGITIHYVNERYDEGEKIFQATCPILSSDTPSDVAAKVHALEYAYFPRVIAETIVASKR